jgi:hypothetical protein
MSELQGDSGMKKRGKSVNYMVKHLRKRDQENYDYQSAVHPHRYHSPAPRVIRQVRQQIEKPQPVGPELIIPKRGNFVSVNDNLPPREKSRQLKNFTYSNKFKNPDQISTDGNKFKNSGQRLYADPNENIERVFTTNPRSRERYGNSRTRTSYDYDFARRGPYGHPRDHYGHPRDHFNYTNRPVYWSGAGPQPPSNAYEIRGKDFNRKELLADDNTEYIYDYPGYPGYHGGYYPPREVNPKVEYILTSKTPQKVPNPVVTDLSREFGDSSRVVFVKDGSDRETRQN